MTKGGAAGIWSGDRRNIFLIVGFVFFVTLTLLHFRSSLFPWSTTTGRAGRNGTDLVGEATQDDTGGQAGPMDTFFCLFVLSGLLFFSLVFSAVSLFSVKHNNDNEFCCF